MKNRFLILVVVMATLFACNSDSMTSDLNESAEKRSDVPFKVKKGSGTYEFGPGIQNSIDDCTGPLRLNATGEVNISHLGKSSVLEEWCWSGANDDLGTRTVTFTAANGDVLTGEITDIDYFDPNNPFIFRETVKVTNDGTGRFEDASGTITQIVEISQPIPEDGVGPFPLIGTFTYTAEGTISYKKIANE